LVLEVLRNRLRLLNHVADSSFQPSLVKLSANTLVALIEHYLPKAERQAVESALRNVDIEGSDLRVLLIGMLQQAGKKIAGAAGNKLAQKIVIQFANIIGYVLYGSGNEIINWFRSN